MRPDIDLRSTFNTRAASILYPLSLLAIAAAALLAGVVQGLVMEPAVVDMELTMIAVTLPLSLVIPVVTVMMVAGEWGDSSIQTTFLQRPGRAAVLGSKVIANTVVTAGILLVSLGFAALGTWVGGELVGESASFASFDSVVTTQLAVLAATWLFSLAMAVLAQSTAIGLVAAIGVPFVISSLGTIAAISGSSLMEDVVAAVDLQAAAHTLAEGDAGALQALALVLTVIVPLAIGARRWMLREIG